MSRPTTAREMTSRQLAEYREAFSMFDKDGDDKISANELGEVLKSLGMDPTKEEIKGDSFESCRTCWPNVALSP